jgi:hypothetical protein
MKIFTRIFVLLAFGSLQTSIAVAQSTAATTNSQSGFVEQGNRTLAQISSMDKMGDEWFPENIDRIIPPVTVAANTTCSLPDVLLETGNKIRQLVNNVDRFTATETVSHQRVSRSGRLRNPETLRFDYLVSYKQVADGYLDVREFRTGGFGPQFPDDIATNGTPSLVLIFHPNYIDNFKMHCEGLGWWRGQPAWQIRFEERTARANSQTALAIDGHWFHPRLRGKAWILANSYQVARLETDLADTIPEIRFSLQHINVEYGPVHFPRSEIEIWLPSTTELYMDFRGHRFYRRHSFSNFKLFSVNVQQTFGGITR